MNKKYDAIIIGAGVGGLVCGCYLAKEGLKVLIVEQHFKPGGYCTSFQRNGFVFDAGAHYFGSVKHGVLGKILTELTLTNAIKFHQFDPTDRIILPDKEILIRSNPQDTFKEFKRAFPAHKKDIDHFFNFILEHNFLIIYSKTKDLTFKNLLDKFFTDAKLKASIGLLLRNLALVPSQTPAMNSIFLLREFILDPGYYPSEGIQSFPDTLKQSFQNHGGEVLLSTRVKRINTLKRSVTSIITSDNLKFEAPIIVSNADATLTFNELLSIKTPETKIIRRLKTTSSMFSVYLGYDFDIYKYLKDAADTWYFPHYNAEKGIPATKQQLLKQKSMELLISFPGLHSKSSHNTHKTTVQISTLSPFFDKAFWDRNREAHCSKIIKIASKTLPFLKTQNQCLMTATPQTFYRYTFNKNGSCFGWIPAQHPRNMLLRNKSSVEGLFLCGHWCNNGNDVGVSGTALSGRKCAEAVLQKLLKPWKYGLIKL